MPKPEAANSAGIHPRLPAHLPRYNHVRHPDATDAAHDAAVNDRGCTACVGRLRQIGAAVSELLEYVLARFKVIGHMRAKPACVRCETISQAAAPSRPIARDVAGQGQPPYARRRERQALARLLLEKLHVWPTGIEGSV